MPIINGRFNYCDLAMQTNSIDSSKDIVVVDDDDLFRESLGRNLSDAGFMVRDFDNGPDALAHFGGGGGGGLMVLDWRMPAMTGIEVLKRLRQTGNPIPVIFLTTLTDQIHEEAALATGAVDFVDKSRSFSIVLRRIELILSGPKGRQPQAEADPEPAPEETWRHGRLTLDLPTNRARWQGHPVELTLAEFKVVHHLARQPGRDVPYRALYDAVRGSGFFAGNGEEGFRANVRTSIKRIRQKFRDIDPDFDQIGNYAGFGYCWRPDRGG